MGYMKHHAIIVTCWKAEHLSEAHAKAVELFGPLASNIVPFVMNHMPGDGSFLIGPDGSKEGWGTSDDHDQKREQFISFLAETGNYADWCEVVIGGDDNAAYVVNATDSATEVVARGGWDTTIKGIAERNG